MFPTPGILARKMNRLDREILKAILTEEQSIYSVNYSVNEVLKKKKD